MYDEDKEELTSLGGKELEIEDLRSRGADTKAQLDATTRAIEQMDLESQATGRISVMSNGDRPLTPFRDTRPTFAAAGGLGGVVVSFGSIILLGLLGRRMDRPEDARTHIVGLPLLGVLPELPDDLADPEQAAIASHSVHQIRALLQIMGRHDRNQVFGITSPAAGTGKTSLTLALGVSFAAAQLKTLLIDCDFVGGGLTERVNLIIRRKIGQILLSEGLINQAQLEEALKLEKESRRRLSEILVEAGYVTESNLTALVANHREVREVLGVLNALSGEDIRNCITETGIENLSMLPLGDASPQHAGCLSPGSLHALIEAAKERFDVVLLDTGPVPGSLEASVVTSQVDAVVLTVARGEQGGSVDTSIAHLVNVRARIAGLVFNRAKTQDVIRYGSSGLIHSRSVTSSNRLKGVMADLTEEFERFGPVARAVASYVPTATSKPRLPKSDD